MKPVRALYAVLASVLLCAGIASISLFVGSSGLTPPDAWREWRIGIPLRDAPALSILVEQRLPRTLAALLAGAGLALAGCSFQALLRNPLATPYTLGVASSAALGAWSAFLLMDAHWIASTVLGIPSVQLLAFLFAGVDVFLVYLVAVGKTRTAPSVLLLAGVTMGMLANSGILLTRYLAQPDRLVMMDRWIMGGVDVIGYSPMGTLVLGGIPCVLLLLAQAAKFDQFSFGADLAEGRGINVRALQLVTFLAASLLTAVIVSEVGPIGFVGLIVPHSVRAFTGARHRLLMPVCLPAGAAFLCFCDIVARVVMPGEIPVGIITTLIGGPFFIHLLIRRKFTDWEN